MFSVLENPRPWVGEICVSNTINSFPIYTYIYTALIHFQYQLIRERMAAVIQLNCRQTWEQRIQLRGSLILFMLYFIYVSILFMYPLNLLREVKFYLCYILFILRFYLCFYVIFVFILCFYYILLFMFLFYLCYYKVFRLPQNINHV